MLFTLTSRERLVDMLLSARMGLWVAVCVSLWTMPVASANSKIVAQGNNVFPCFRGDENFTFASQANCEGLGARAGQKAYMRYNDMGLRDVKRAAQAAPGTIRILVLGPSNLVAPGLTEEQMPTVILERLLKSNYPQNTFEVINGGHEGYFSAALSARLRELQNHYKAELVVYFTSGAVIGNDAYYYDFVRFDEKGNVAAVPLPLMDSYFPDWVANILQKKPQLRSAVYSWYWVMKRAWFGIRTQIEFKRGRYLEFMAKRSLPFIENMQSTAQSTGAAFLVSMIPSNLTYTNIVYANFDPTIAVKGERFVPNYRWPANDFIHILKTKNIPVLSLPMELDQKQYLLPGDWHFNAEGAAFWAAIMSEALEPQIRASKNFKKEEAPAKGKKISPKKIKEKKKP